MPPGLIGTELAVSFLGPRQRPTQPVQQAAGRHRDSLKAPTDTAIGRRQQPETPSVSHHGGTARPGETTDRPAGPAALHYDPRLVSRRPGHPRHQRPTRTVARWCAPVRPRGHGGGAADQQRHRPPPEPAEGVQALPAPAMERRIRLYHHQLFHVIKERGKQGRQQIVLEYRRPGSAGAPNSRTTTGPSRRCGRLVSWIMSDPANIGRGSPTAERYPGPQPQLATLAGYVCSFAAMMCGLRGQHLDAPV